MYIVRDALQHGKDILARTEKISPDRHTELLLEFILRCSREQLYLRMNEPFSPQQAKTFDILLKLREGGEPVQYIVGWAPFYGITLDVGKGVFIPRFDTEVMVEHVLNDISTRNWGNRRIRLLDLCCGTGAVGISAAVECPQIDVTLLDHNFIAVKYATVNALKNGITERSEVIQWNALEQFPLEWHGQFDYITSNPPYIPAADIAALHSDVKNGEPRDAITDGGDGLSFYRRWTETVPILLQPDGRFYTECGMGQARWVRRLLSPSFTDMIILNDLNGIERIVTGVKK